MTRAIDLSQSELAIVRDVLRPTFPPAHTPGSSAPGRPQRLGAIPTSTLPSMGDAPLDPVVLSNVAEAMSESDLPYKVDVIDLCSVDPAFRAVIQSTMVALPF